MSLSHNAEADFAASELARMIVADPSLCYGATPPAGLSATAAYEPSSSPWPKADGLISILETGSGGKVRDIALEYKRPQEGLHGVLTAIGQAQGYIHKGYNGAAVVIPRTYPSRTDPGQYVRDVLDKVSTSKAVGVFHYDPPDTSSPTPFAGRLECVRPIELIATTKHVGGGAGTVKTQWVHMREGSTTRDAFFRFLQTAKKLSADDAPPTVSLPSGLVAAVARLAPGKSAEMYLSNTSDDKFLSRVWRAFWFGWIATPDVLTPWRKTASGDYEEPNALTKILKDDGTGYSQIWEGRAGSLKAALVEQLNNKAITEDQAWEYFVTGFAVPGKQKKQGIRERAHSYREDIDSSLAQLGWINPDGTPSDFGYRYMAICERYGGPNSAAAIEYVGATLLQTGHYASFLHYVYRLSEKLFAADPLHFSRLGRAGKPVFNEDSYREYLLYLENTLSDDLKVMRKVSGRARPRKRTPFQAELTLLRNYGFVSKARYRLGVGLPIDWEKVLSAVNVML